MTDRIEQMRDALVRGNHVSTSPDYEVHEFFDSLSYPYDYRTGDDCPILGISVCRECSALVSDDLTHIEWHVRQAPKPKTALTKDQEELFATLRGLYASSSYLPLLHTILPDTKEET
jgi:hypothetical protein